MRNRCSRPQATLQEASVVVGGTCVQQTKVHDRSGDGAQEDGQEAEDPPAEEQDEAEDLPGEIQDPEPAAPAAHPHHGFAGWGWHPHRHGHHAHSLGQSNLQVKDEAHQSQAYWDTAPRQDLEGFPKTRGWVLWRCQRLSTKIMLFLGYRNGAPPPPPPHFGKHLFDRLLLCLVEWNHSFRSP